MKKRKILFEEATTAKEVSNAAGKPRKRMRTRREIESKLLEIEKNPDARTGAVLVKETLLWVLMEGGDV